MIRQYQAVAGGNEQRAEIIRVHDPRTLLYGGKARDEGEEGENEGMQPECETEEETNRKEPGRTDGEGQTGVAGLDKKQREQKSSIKKGISAKMANRGQCNRWRRGVASGVGG